MSDVTWIPITQRERLSKGPEPILLASWFCSLLLFFTDWVNPWPTAVSSNFRSCQGEQAPLWDHLLVESGPDAQTRVSRAGQAAISTERERRALHRSHVSQPWLALPAEFCRHVTLSTPAITHLPGVMPLAGPRTKLHPSPLVQPTAKAT